MRSDDHRRVIVTMESGQREPEVVLSEVVHPDGLAPISNLMSPEIDRDRSSRCVARDEEGKEE